MKKTIYPIALLISICPFVVVEANGEESAQTARRTPVVEVFEAARDAVVNISSKEIITVRDPFGFDGLFEEFFDMPFQERFRPRARQYTRTSVGSGFVIHSDGYIVTNAHVVAQTAERKVTFADGKEFDAHIVAVEPDRDLAVLKIETDQPVPTVPLGRSNDLMIGETVIAIGNPLGYQNTVTAGVISAVGRDVEFGSRMALHDLVQTDASINPGNSGGPLLNVLGELIGVNSAIRGDAQNIGFAIPVDQLREVLPELLDVERRHRIVCGMRVDNLDVPRVIALQQGSPADEAGVKAGDVLLELNGRPIRQGMEFDIALLEARAGQTIRLALDRQGKRIETDLTLKARPLPDGAALAREKMGVEVEELPPEVAETLGLPGATGLLIVQVEPGGPADQMGLQRRDILVAIGRHAVATVDDLGQLFEFVESGERVSITILRVDQRMKMKLSGELRAR